jgi:hypothetical protein
LIVVVSGGPSSASDGPPPTRPAAPAAEAEAMKLRRVCKTDIEEFLPSVHRRRDAGRLLKPSTHA